MQCRKSAISKVAPDAHLRMVSRLQLLDTSGCCGKMGQLRKPSYRHLDLLQIERHRKFTTNQLGLKMTQPSSPAGAITMSSVWRRMQIVCTVNVQFAQGCHDRPMMSPFLLGPDRVFPISRTLAGKALLLNPLAEGLPNSLLR